MDNYEAAALQEKALEEVRPWYQKPFEYMWLGLKWVLATFIFVILTHDMVKYIIDNWGK